LSFSSPKAAGTTLDPIQREEPEPCARTTFGEFRNQPSFLIGDLANGKTYAPSAAFSRKRKLPWARKSYQRLERVFVKLAELKQQAQSVSPTVSIVVRNRLENSRHNL